MRTITGAILIIGAIWLFISAFPYSVGGGVMADMIKLAIILAGLAALLGVFFLFVGSVEAKETARWYQFTIKSLLAVTLMVALFFSGRALGLREAASQYPYVYPAYSAVRYSVAPPAPVYVAPCTPAPVSSSSASVSVDPSVPPAATDTSAPQQSPPSVSSPENASTPPSTPATQTP